MRTKISIVLILGAVITILFAVLIVGCKKETTTASEVRHSTDEGPKPGFVPGYPTASGFFYCDVAMYPLLDSSDYEWRISGFAIFKEPAKKLNYEIDPDRNIDYMYAEGDLNLGEITLNEYPLAFNDYNKLYKGRPRQPMSPDTAIRWRVQGSATTHDQALFDDFFSQPFPKFNSAKSTYPQFLKSQDYKLEVSDYFFNYDSIWINAPQLEIAMMKPGTNYVQFEAQHIKYTYPNGCDSVRAELKASKYYYALHGGRYYQYIFVAKFPISLSIVNQ